MICMISRIVRLNTEEAYSNIVLDILPINGYEVSIFVASCVLSSTKFIWSSALRSWMHWPMFTTILESLLCHRAFALQAASSWHFKYLLLRAFIFLSFGDGPSEIFHGYHSPTECDCCHCLQFWIKPRRFCHYEATLKRSRFFLSLFFISYW